ncbi:dedicator of cytokinesis 7 [Naegleria gruberi]|uniref:Dedicator of cytokinesis 7 n=1 Tax=Naegleria gruberi TaxID=5762 RepID=D2V377_NAEGR|nr:dedicator of cytokinesis 7 [Naegleria gruberi]EFC48586.1 dedicator of cytokinesis 7 [Naegleria gruberi]|eukprot:XP_002681330.1 dedicator of cytokinesis 7 [Naegleria gruberi strain NEG-M]
MPGLDEQQSSLALSDSSLTEVGASSHSHQLSDVPRTSSFVSSTSYSSHHPQFQFEQQYAEYQVKIDQQFPSVKDSVLFPDDLVKIIETSKPSNGSRANTVGSISNVPHHIKEQFRYFESPHISIDYANHGKFEKASLEKLKVRSKELEYEVDKKKPTHTVSSSSIDVSASSAEETSTSPSTSENNFTKLMKETETTQPESVTPTENLLYNVEDIVDNIDKTSQKIHSNVAYIKNANQKLNKTMFMYDMSTQSVEWDWNGGAEAQICKRMRDRKVPLKHSPIMIELLDFMPKLFTEKYDSEKIEPFFITYCLVDFNTRKRISEEFHCDVNHQLSDESLRKLLTSSDLNVNLSKNRAIFQVSERSPDISLYVRIYKIIQGDEDDAAEPYVRPEKCKDAKSKFFKNVHDNVFKMRPFLQPMAYSFQQMFNENEDLCLNSEISHFLRTKGNMGDDQFFNIYSGSATTPSDSSLGASGTKGKLKTFPANMKLRVIELNSDDYNELKNEIDQVDCTVDIDGTKYDLAEEKLKCHLIREISSSKLNYFHEYDNTLYVYPQTVQIGSRGLIGTKSKSVSVKIELKNNDDNLDAPGLPLIFNRFNKDKDSKTTHDYSTITYHAKHPEFNDEFKIQLPTHITDKHHLLFTFVHVPCKNKESASGKDELPYKANIGNVLGYSFVPLLDFTTPNKQRRKTIEDDTSSMSFNLGKLLSGVEQLPIYQEFSEKKGYTSERVKGTSKLMENGKPLFTVSFQPFSTIYTTDKSLAHFFASLPLVISDNEVRDSVMIVQRHSTSEPSDLVGSSSGLVSSPSIMKNIASDDLFDGEMPAIGTNSPLLRSSNSGALLSSMNPEMMVIKYLSEMSHVQVRDLVNFLPSIFNQLLRTICTGMCYNHTMKNAQFQAFQLLLVIIDRVNRYYLETSSSRNQDEERVSSDSSSERNRLIKDYVDKIFVNFHHCDSFVFIELINQWINMLEDTQIRRSKKSEQSKLRMAALENNDDNESKMSLMYSWVLFDLIIKSLTLYLKEKKLLNTSDRSKMFSGGNGRLVEFQNLLLRLVRIMGVETAYRAGAGFNVAKILNSNFALFLRDLFNIMDRGIVLGHIEGYMNIITDRAGTEGNANYEVIQEFRNTFLEIIVDYEFYVNISLPYFYKPGSSHNPNEDCEVITDEQKLCTNHYLCGLLMKWCVDDLANKERVVRSRSISLMRNIITKHEYDKRYQNKDVQVAISNMYFAYVLLFIDIFHKFKKASESKLTEIRNIVNKAKNDFQQKLNELSKQQQEQQDQPQPQQLKDLEDSVQISKKQYNDTLTQFKDEKERSKLEKQQALITVIFILFNMDRELFLKWFETESFNRKKILLQIIYMSVQVFQYSGRKKIEENHKLGIGAHTNTGKSLNEAKSRLENLYTSLDRRIPNRPNPNTGRRNFKDRMNFTTQNRSVRGGQTGSITESSLAAQINKSGGGSISSRSTVSSTNSTGTTRSNIPFKESEKKIIDDLVLWESRLNVEISSCILSLMLDICKKFQFSSIMDLILNLEINRKRNELEIFHHVFHILMSFFKTNQADCSLIALYHLLRVFVKKFRSTIFTSKNAEYIEVLSKLVLRQSQSVVDRVRAEATALLYWMIKQNYLSDELYNFTRTKIQTTVALSYLASEFENGVNIQLLRESFQIISDYAAADKSVPQLPPQDVKSNQPKVFEIKKPSAEEDDSAYKMPFSQQVKQLVERLRKTLLDTVQIEELKKRKADQETMCDLYHRIAGGYKHAPELSVTWYHNLAQEHIKHERYIEAAECYVYIAGVVFEYLKLRRDKAVWGGQYGSEQKKVNELSQYLLNISPYLRSENFSELRALFQRKPSENTEGPVGPEFESHYFNRDGMVQLIYSAIHFCKEDGYYEYMIELHKLLLGLFEIEGNFERMKSVHNELSNLYAKIAEPKTRSARLFGAYYRIYFVGQLFPENVREKEFVYKMPKTTRLNSLMTYLKDHFRFGKELKIIGDSQIITDAMKQEDEAYVQITSVKPYYDPTDAVAYEISNSDRYFNENVNISKFIFETPFTMAGKKSHGSITEQCKRKTIIKTKITFPSVLNRSEVLSKDHTELTPIENSTEIVEMSIQRLATACSGADQVNASEKDEGKNKQVFRFGRILDDDFDVDEEFATDQTEATPVTILPVGDNNVTPTSPSDDLVNVEKKKQSAPIDVSQLHLVLTGVVIPSVNEGIPHIVNSFLHPDEVSKYEPQFVKNLKKACVEFLRSCYRAILISNEYCSDAQRPLHNKFEEGYVTLISVFEKCIDIPEEIREIRKN